MLSYSPFPNHPKCSKRLPKPHRGDSNKDDVPFVSGYLAGWSPAGKFFAPKRSDAKFCGWVELLADVFVHGWIASLYYAAYCQVDVPTGVHPQTVRRQAVVPASQFNSRAV